MAHSKPIIRNYHIAVKEVGNKVIFLRKLTPGSSEHSFGIHVARMAGMPGSLLQRDEALLKVLEKKHSDEELNPGKSTVNTSHKEKEQDQFQLSFFQLDDPLLERIRDDIARLDIDTLTHVEALMKLNEIKKLLKKY